MNTDLSFKLHTKINLNIKYKTIKFTGKKKRKSSGLGLGKQFLNFSPKVHAVKEKFDKFYFIKTFPLQKTMLQYKKASCRVR